jgi:hypothetical protein
LLWTENYVQTLESLNIAADASGWKLFKHKIPTSYFYGLHYIAVLCFRLSLSFIPVAGFTLLFVYDVGNGHQQVDWIWVCDCWTNYILCGYNVN